MEFDHAIKARQVNKSPKAQTGALCGPIISAVDNKKDAAETAVALREYWKIVPEFEQYTHTQAVETRVSRALLMLSSSKAYSWVVSIATEAILFPTNETWFSKLATDIKREWRKRHHDPTVPQEATFNSKDYLPSLTDSCEAVLPMKRWMLKNQEEGLIHFITFVIETWLHFPNSRHMNDSYKVRSALISITVKYMPLSVLYLDDIWNMYMQPYSFVIHGRPREGARQRISHSHTLATLALFEKSIQKHLMSESTSKEHLLLMVLQKYTESWFKLTASRMLRGK